jgi:hypothetical protein
MKAINLKSKKEYKVLHPNVVDATNDREGQLLVIYTDDSNTLYAIESIEFYSKFKILNDSKTTKAEVCEMCGVTKVLYSDNLCKKCFDKLPS